MSIPFSLHVTLGQDFLPGRVGTAGGMTLGLAVSIGGVATPVLGTIAEHTSLRVALSHADRACPDQLPDRLRPERTGHCLTAGGALGDAAVDLGGQVVGCALGQVVADEQMDEGVLPAAVRSST